MTADPRRVKELFVAALDLPDPQARQAFLERECGADADLRQRLDVLLRAHDHPASVLDRPLAWPTGRHRPPRPDHGPAEDVGTVIAGRYKLLRADRRRRHGHGLGGRADAAGPPQGRPEAHQGGHGLEDGPGPLRGGAAGPGR